MKIADMINNPIKPINNVPVSPIDTGINNTSIEKPVEDDGLSFDAVKNAYGEQQLKEVGAVECSTCADRTYVDGSNDPGVSFKTPGKIAPESSAAVVMSHELEHVGNEQSKAAAEDREVISQSVTLHSSICPECGKAYVSGGETRTTTQDKKKYEIPNDFLKGLFVDQEL